jgi:hypothetical protein
MNSNNAITQKTQEGGRGWAKSRLVNNEPGNLDVDL